MNRKVGIVVLCAFLAVFVAAPLLTTAHAASLEEAIAKAPKGTEKGQINPDAAPGFLGIPGGPDLSLIVGFLWAIWVGWIFSTVGAFGGIMAGVGHMTIYGLGSYAKVFKSTAPDLNKFITDSIRVSNQWLVGLSALVSSINYAKQKRLVTALGFFLGIGALFATLLIVFSTAGKIKFSQYQGWFGLCVFVIGGFMVYEMTPKGQASKKAAQAAAKAFEATTKAKGNIEDQGVKTLKWSLTKTEISFFGQKFSFSPHLGVRRRFYHLLHRFVSWGRRGVPVCSLPDQCRRASHVRGGGHLGPLRVDRHDLRHLQLHGPERGHGLLADDRRRTGRYLYRFDDRAQNR